MRAAGFDVVKLMLEGGVMYIHDVWHGLAHGWEKMPWLIATWKEISGGKAVLS